MHASITIEANNQPVDELTGTALPSKAGTNSQGCGRTETAARNFLERNPLPNGKRQQFAMLPFEYISSLYQVLLDSGKVKFLDFRDLPFSADQDIRSEEGLAELYKLEFPSWRNGILDGMPNLHLLIQHDSDDGALETEFMCGFEAEVGIKSTTAVFCREIDSGGDLYGYGIDYALLKRLQDEKNMCFAYHCNAAELSGYDKEKIATVFDEDVELLRAQGLDIRFFSPHGGVVGPQGLNNNSFFYPSFSRHRLIWTHNRFSPTGLRYSDGSWIARIKTGDPRLDLREFLTSKLALAAPHKNRHFILLHPQYYFAKDSRAAEEYFPANPWLKEFWDLHAQGKAIAYWEPLRKSLSAVV